MQSTTHAPKLRVLQLLQRPQRRGAEVFAYQLSAWLARHGHLTANAYLYPASESEPLALGASDVLLGGAEGHLLERVPGLNPTLLGRLLAEVDRFRPDIVQLNGARTVKYGAAARALRPRSPWRVVYRNIDSPSFWVRGWVRRTIFRHLVMRHVDGVVGVSQRTLGEARSLYALRVPSVHVPNGIDLEALRPRRCRADVRADLGTDELAVVAIFIGRLGLQKRPDRFLRVLAAARRSFPDLVGWVLGDGPDRAAVEEQAAALGLTSGVRFLGSRAEVASIIAAADVYVSTSDTEGIPAVVAEAGHLGLPTLGPSVGGMSECVVDGSTGLLGPPGDEAALTMGLVRLASDASLRAALGAAARDRVGRLYSMEHVGTQYLGFYRDVLAGIPAPRAQRPVHASEPGTIT